jgi:hypothetical protein
MDARLPSAPAVIRRNERRRMTGAWNHEDSTMIAFDYGVEAGLFSYKGPRSRPNSLGYKRFARAADAIRFAMENVSSDMLRSCSLEVGDTRYVGAEIRNLYENADYPLIRRANSAE